MEDPLFAITAVNVATFLHVSTPLLQRSLGLLGWRASLHYALKWGLALDSAWATYNPFQITALLSRVLRMAIFIVIVFYS